jgi:hypothetical protein
VNVVEDDLIRRIDVKRALATRLQPREREIIRDCCRYGMTFREIGALRGFSSARIGQLYARAERRLRVALAEPKQVSHNGRQPVGFDRAAFLRHMRGLIALRDEHRSREFEDDYAVVAGLLQHEREKKRPAAPPPPPPPLPVYTPAFSHPLNAHSEAALTRIASTALDAFMALLNPTEEGSETLGAMFTTFPFDCFDSATVRHAVRIMRAAMPFSVRLSRWIMPIPPGMCGAVVANEYVAVRALSVGAALQTRLDITWDPI